MNPPIEPFPEPLQPAEDRLSTAELAGAGAPKPDDKVGEARRFDSGGEPAAEQARAGQGDEKLAPLYTPEEADKLRAEWAKVQASFVDEPRQAVEHADSLVAGAMKQLAEKFAAQRSDLEHQWDRGGDISTEDLRVTLRSYRSFFDRLLAV